MEPLWQDWERAAVESKLSEAIVGSDRAVKTGLQKLVSETGANEVIVVIDTYEHADRVQSHQRVAGIARTIEPTSTVTMSVAANPLSVFGLGRTV